MCAYIHLAIMSLFQALEIRLWRKEDYVYILQKYLKGTVAKTG